MSTGLGARWLVAPTLASVSLAVWFGEVWLVTGWHGLQWLEVCWSLRIVPVLASLAVLGSSRWEAGWARSAGFVVAHTVLVWGVSTVAGDVLAGWMRYPVVGLPRLGAMALGFSVVYGLGLWALVRLLLGRVGWWWLAIWCVAGLLFLPLGWLTIQVVPPPAGTADLLHAIKVGWPAFWAVWIVGWMAAPSLDVANKHPAKAEVSSGP